MAEYKTPGVYIKEKKAFSNSIVEVATAVPAFIGYTDKADDAGKSRLNKPTRITSMAQFRNYFGGEPPLKFELKKLDGAGESDFKVGNDSYVVEQTGQRYRLYYSMMHFFQNGGGPCYIVSVGDYKKPIAEPDLTGGIGTLVSEQEPTLVVIPECVSLEEGPTCYSVQNQMLMHCGQVMKNRFAVLDVHDGFKGRKSGDDCIERFRGGVNPNFASFGAAYYPWLETTVVSDRDVSFLQVANNDLLAGLLATDLGGLPADASDRQKSAHDALLKMFEEVGKGGRGNDDDNRALSEALLSMSTLYKNVMKAVRAKANLLPPSAAMAGIYTQVDNTRGVWKAPANVGVASVVAPAVPITHDEQEDLNATPQGKSVNAIRAFIGEGALVWGARTLDGNSLDWRYLNVRRTMLFLQESCKLAAKAMVFEPNVATTWTTIKSMIENFLNSVWKRGGLMGAVPEDAYEVHVGLGDTMTPEDVLEGILRVTVRVAMVRPAEFIEITFQQLMPKS